MAATDKEANDIFAELMNDIKHIEKAKRVLKKPSKDVSPGELAEANAIRQQWIDAEWRETAFGPMFLRQVCNHCGMQTQSFGGWFVESSHLHKRDTVRMVRVHDQSDAGELSKVRFFREEEVDFCAEPGCITGFDNTPWKR